MTSKSLDELKALDQLLEDASKLIRAQEREVARLHAAGLDPAQAESLLEAYRMSARIAATRKQEIEAEIARQSSGKSPPR
jgi:hypothetical protein